jgi:hypothetical protein
MPDLLYSYSEVESLEGAATSSRYLWRAKADLELFERFPVSAAADFSRTLLQYVIARSKERLNLSAGLATPPSIPTPVETIEFDRARRLVEREAEQHEIPTAQKSAAHPENEKWDE